MNFVLFVIKHHELYYRASFEIMTRIRPMTPLLYIMNFSKLLISAVFLKLEAIYNRVAPVFWPMHPVRVRVAYVEQGWKNLHSFGGKGFWVFR